MPGNHSNGTPKNVITSPQIAKLKKNSRDQMTGKTNKK